MAERALRLTGLSKSFAGVRALDGVTFEVDAGEVHALVGGNGSGKSTLIKVLAGYHTPDPGAQLELGGRPVGVPLPPGSSARLGLSFVHQDLGLIPSLSILENMRVGRYQPGRGGRISWRKERQAVTAALRHFGLDDLASATPVGLLSPLHRALVAIARAFADAELHQGGLVILDEPTAYLPTDGVDRLFDAIGVLRRNGTAAVIVTHRLEEVFRVADRVTVLREGRAVGTASTADIDEARLIELILGRKLDEYYPEGATAIGDTVLSVRNLQGRAIHDLSFDVHRGEILGLAGLVGMGHTEVPYLIFGATPARSGTVELAGRPPVAAGTLTPRQAAAMGIGLLPADRLGGSGVGGITLRENVSLPIVDRFFQGGRIRRSAEGRYVAGLLRDHDVRPPFPESPLAMLSGGNQQKALLAKWLQMQLPVMLLDEPTQGADIGARKEIFQRLREAAQHGACMVMASSEFDDLAGVCDRVLVFRHGRIVGELAGAALSEDRLTAAAYSSRPAA